jgi:hypothetical protein
VFLEEIAVAETESAVRGKKHSIFPNVASSSEAPPHILPHFRFLAVGSVLLVLALAVIGKDLDDPALGNPAVVARDHSLEFVTQGGEARDLVVDLCETVLHGSVGESTEPTPCL